MARVVARSGLLGVFKAAAARVDGRGEQETAAESAPAAPAGAAGREDAADAETPADPGAAVVEASAVAAENIQLCFLAAIERAQTLS